MPGSPALSASELPDDELLAEVKRRGLSLESTDSCSGAFLLDGGTVHRQASGEKKSEPRGRLPSHMSEEAENPEPWVVGPPGKPLVPQLFTGQAIQARIRESGKLNHSSEYSWSIKRGNAWQRIAVATESPESRGALGRKSVHVTDASGAEAFKLVRATSTWNPVQLRFSFRVLPADCQDSDASHPLFTVNRGVLGSHAMGLTGEKWSVFCGKEHDHKEDHKVVYHVVSAAFGWSYDFFKGDDTQHCNPVAHVALASGTGTVACSVSGTWVPACFEISIGESEDAALVMAVATIFDMAHEVSRPHVPV